MKKSLLILGILLLLIVVFFIRYGAIFGPKGLFDKAYHRQAIVNPHAPPGHEDLWEPDEPYLCPVMKDPSNPENPFTHCPINKYLGHWLLWPDYMKTHKAK